MSAVADFDRTRAIQREASDPAASAWVVANAGSGKTHVLTQRVIRLLLAGADPAAILCLTFTKVAAAEMARRVFGTLGEWTMLPDAELAARDRRRCRDARRPPRRCARRAGSSPRALETPGGLKIQTIHAFCERLLHQFPFEANVPGQFAVLDDTAAAALIADARARGDGHAAAASRRRGSGAPCAISPRARDRHADRRGARRADRTSATRSAAGSSCRAPRRRGGERRRRARRPARAARPRAGRDGRGDLPRDLRRARAGACEDCGDARRRARGVRRTGPIAARMHALRGDRRAPATPSREADRAARLLPDRRRRTAGNAAARRTASARASRKRSRGLPERFAAEVGAAAARSPAGSTSPAPSPRPRRCSSSATPSCRPITPPSGASGMLDFADLIAKTRNLLSRADAAAWVLYKLDRAHRAHPGRRGAGYEPRPMGGGAGDRRGFLRRRGRRRGDAHDLRGRRRQAVDLRLPGRGAAHAGGDAALLRARSRGRRANASSRRPLFLSFRSTREVLDAVDKVFDERAGRQITASELRARMRRSRRRRARPRRRHAARSCGRKVGGAGGLDRRRSTRRPRRRRSWRDSIADEIARLTGHAAALRQARCATARSSSWCASATPSPPP